jgi:uncharacterized membrane protein YjjB (DUF3815 family)
MNLFIQSIFAAGATFGFTILFNTRKSESFLAAIAGGLGWLLYLVAFESTSSLFTANLLAATLVGAISEIYAKLLKKPATIFIVSAIIPLVPGDMIFNTMSNAIHGMHTEAINGGIDTLIIAGAIATGLAFSSSAIKVIWSFRKQ